MISGRDRWSSRAQWPIGLGHHQVALGIEGDGSDPGDSTADGRAPGERHLAGREWRATRKSTILDHTGGPRPGSSCPSGGGDHRAQAVQIGATTTGRGRRTLALTAADQLATREERDETREGIDYETDAKLWQTRQGSFDQDLGRPGESRARYEGCGLSNPGTSCRRCGHGNSGQPPSADQNNGHDL